MKVFLLANVKGGVGKSMFTTQFAYYCVEKLGLKTLVIDLDHQANSTKSLKLSELCVVSKTSSSDILMHAKPIDIKEPFALIYADDNLENLERAGDRHNDYVNNFVAALHDVSDYYDVCIIDTNPNTDIRQTTAIIAATHILSPIELNQEAIDGIGRLFSKIKKLKKINKELVFLGLIPNLVESTPFQKNNLKELTTDYGQLLLKLNNGKVALMPTRTALAEAQAAGLPVWSIPKTSAKTAWKELGPVFEVIAERLGFAIETKD